MISKNWPGMFERQEDQIIIKILIWKLNKKRSRGWPRRGWSQERPYASGNRKWGTSTAKDKDI